MRSDSRLTYRDIKARMAADELPSDNALNMRREREARNPLGLSCWTSRRGDVSRVEVERVERWTPDQISYNTTMVVEYTDPSPDGAKRAPLHLRSKTLVPAAPVYFPLDTFLENGRQHIPSRRIAAAIDLFYRLSEKAVEQQLDTWQDLGPSDLPWRSSKHSKGNGPGKKHRNKVRHTRRWKCPRAPTNDGSQELQEGNSIELMDAPASESENMNAAHESQRAETSSDTDDEGIRVSGLPKIEAHYNCREPVDVHVDNKQQWDSNVYGGSASKALNVVQPWTTVNRPLASHSSGVDQPTSNAVVVDKPRQVVPFSSFGDIRLRQTAQQALSSLGTITQQTSQQETVDGKHIKPDPEAQEPESNTEPRWFNRYRFNGSGPYSVRNNHNHALHTSTDEVMRRNNPFEPQNMEGDGMPTALEKYLNESIRRFGGAGYPSP